MNLFPANEAVLNNYYPEILKAIHKCEGMLPQFNIGVEDSCFFYKNGSSIIYPYGQSKAQDLVNRWLNYIKPKPGNCYALCGFGLGFHIEALLQKADPETYFFIAEADPTWLKRVFSTIDCSKLLSNNRIQLATGAINERFFSGLTKWVQQSIKDTQPLIFSPLHNIYPIYYNKFLREFVRFCKKYF